MCSRSHPRRLRVFTDANPHDEVQLCLVHFFLGHDQAHSRGETEYYGMVKTVSIGRGIMPMLKGLHVRMRLAVLGCHDRQRHRLEKRPRIHAACRDSVFMGKE